ncbi:hypothetical protein OA165_00100 [Prochlorococcus sp. AH-736-A21]|nr:hypothetical protein [Prochlorococcus sp. AH-736-A21]
MTQINKIYYSICSDNENYYRTIRIHRNPFTGNLTSQVSNPVIGGKEQAESLGFEPIPPLMRQRLQSCNNALPYTF